MIGGVLVLCALAYVALRTRPDVRSVPRAARTSVLRRLFGVPRPRVADVLGLAWLVSTAEGSLYLGVFNTWLDVSWALAYVHPNADGAPDAPQEQHHGDARHDAALSRGHACWAAGDWAGAASAYDAAASAAPDAASRLDALERAATAQASCPEKEGASHGVSRLLALAPRLPPHRAARVLTAVSEHGAASTKQVVDALTSLRSLRASDDGPAAATVLQVDVSLGAAQARAGDYGAAGQSLLSAARSPAAVRPGHYYAQAAAALGASSPTRVHPDLVPLVKEMEAACPEAAHERAFVSALVEAVESGRGGALAAARKRLAPVPAWVSAALRVLCAHLDADDLL